ncbi:MAG: hypothetical protein WBG69_07010, partial [Arcobacteraceae bacterium]
FFEDTIIVLVLVIILCIGFFIYDKYSQANHIEKFFDETTTSVENFFKVVQKLPEEINDFIVREKERIDQIPEEVIEEVIDTNQTNNIVKTNFDENTTQSLKIDEPKIEKEILPIIEKVKEPIPEVQEKVQKEKSVDRVMLKTFLNNLESQLKSSIVLQNDSNTTKDVRNLRFRVTILKDGSYEQLTFVDGDKDLFDQNEENILKNFPVIIDEKIKDEFPRYIRINI